MPILTNQKHELFAQGLAKGLSANQAYIAAGYAENDGNACRLNGNERVRARLAELQASAVDRTLVTVESITAELEQARLLALAGDTASPSAAVAASMGKAKLHGLLVERREFTGKDGGPIATDNTHHSEVAVSETAAFIAGALRDRAEPTPPKSRQN